MTSEPKAARSRQIPLTRGKVALVDEADYDAVAQFKWTYAKTSRAREYAARWVRREDGSRSTIYMHRFILGATRGKQVDHKNGDGLDNRRENLRFATSSQNNANRDHPGPGYRGVYNDSRTGRYVARIKVRRRMRHLGCFDTAEEAACAYDTAARAAFGPFARPNFEEVQS